ncbi:MAG: transposase [Candidatus Omnitrophica bacterium]|nr:transposase [Candidatus Omnitrophota bacterium]
METANLEDMVSRDAPVRAIWAFVEQLDLTSYYSKIKSKLNEAGSPAYNPKLLLAMWIYAYSQGISSAREVERLTTEAKSWRWLCGKTKSYRAHSA